LGHLLSYLKKLTYLGTDKWQHFVAFAAFSVPDNSCKPYLLDTYNSICIMFGCIDWNHSAIR